MNTVFSVLGGMSAVLLLGSFLVEGAAQDVMRLVGGLLLIAYSVYKLTRSGKDSGSG